MKKFLILMLIVIPNLIFAQEADTTLNKWIPLMITGLNISQITFENWTKGGENSLAWTITGDFELSYATEKWKFNNQLKAAYGRTKLGDVDFRTTDNELYLESVVSYIVGWPVDLFFSNTVRTQITKGYDYSVDPVQNISNLFDPGYLTQALGIVYNKKEHFETRLGIALQEVVTNKFRQYSDPENLQDKFLLETGIESVTSGEVTIDENMLLKSKLRLFSRFDSMDVWDVRWDNTITAQVNSWLNVNLGVLVIYEKAQSPKTQLKEALQLGITYTIF